MRIVVLMIVFDRWCNADRWRQLWNAVPREELLCIVRNANVTSLRVTSEKPIIEIERPNVGFDLGVFQDAVKGRLPIPEWEWLFVAPDDFLPMDVHFLDYFRQLAAESPTIGLVGSRLWCPGIVLPVCRSGGFMIRRDVAERLSWPADPMITKDDCHDLETRTHHMLEQIKAMGVEVRFLPDSVQNVIWDSGHESHQNRLSEFPILDQPPARILVAVVVYTRWRNADRWIRAWNAIQRSESLAIVHNVDGGIVRTVTYNPLVIERPNIGLDLGVFQDIVRGRLPMPDWNWLFFAPDDWLPMELDFLEPFKKLAADPSVGLVGGRSNEVPKDNVQLHCRSGGFIVRRDVAERLAWPADPITNREQCFELESRTYSLMDQVQSMGLSVKFLDESDKHVLWDQGHEHGQRGIRDFPAFIESDLFPDM